MVENSQGPSAVILRAASPAAAGQMQRPQPHGRQSPSWRPCSGPHPQSSGSPREEQEEELQESGVEDSRRTESAKHGLQGLTDWSGSQGAFKGLH